MSLTIPRRNPPSAGSSRRKNFLGDISLNPIRSLHHIRQNSFPVEAIEVGPHATSDALDPLSLPDILRLAIVKWRVVAGGSALGVLLGMVAFAFGTPAYRAHTTIEVQNLNADFLDVRETSPTQTDRHGDMAVLDLQTEMELIQSAQVLNATKAALKQEWLNRFVSSKGESPYPDALLDRIAGSVSAQSTRGQMSAQVNNTRIVEIQVDAPNALLAANFANTLVAEFIRQTMATRRRMTEAAEASTQVELAAIRQKLEASDRKLEGYATAHQLIFAPERQTISDDRLRQLKSDVLQARADLAQHRSQHDLMANAGPALPSALEDNELIALRSKLQDLQRQEAALLTIFTPKSIDVKKVQAQERQLQLALADQRRRIVGRIQNQYQQSIEKEKLLSAAYAAAVQQTGQESKSAVQYDLLKHEVDANLISYEKMLAKGKELTVAVALQTSNIRVLDPAVPPVHQNAPKLPVNAAVGWLTGFILALGWVVIRERTDEKLRRPGEAFFRLGVCELAAIPSQLEVIENTGPALGFLMPPATPGDGLALVRAAVDDYPATPESFRTLAASILLARPQGPPPGSIVVASCFPGEGKTTVASHLAVACARVGKRVLLIDGDLRHPRIHLRFALPNQLGLGDLLEGRLPAAEASHILLSTKTQRLKILSAGACHSPAPDLLFDPGMAQVLEGLKPGFDLILIDTPPLLRVPDARLMARYSDGVVLVARANQTDRKAVALGVDRLRQDNSVVLGVVLNDWSAEA